MKFTLLSSASIIALGGALAVVPALVGGQAYAVPISGSAPLQIGGIIPVGGTGDLLSATSFNFTSTTWHAGTHATPFFTLIPQGTAIGDSTLTLSSLGSYTFTSADGNFTAAPSMVVSGNTFTSKVVASSGSIAAGTESLSIYLVGNFVPAGTLSGFSSDNASETISFTETGITSTSPGSFSVSATFASPAAAPPGPPPVPEPASMALLGAGLVGLGAIRRRRA
jgi:PEP-CTERM motif